MAKVHYRHEFTQSEFYAYLNNGGGSRRFVQSQCGVLYNSIKGTPALTRRKKSVTCKSCLKKLVAMKKGQGK